MKKHYFIMIIFVITVSLFSCGNLPPPTVEKPYRSLSRIQNAVVIGTVESMFLARDVAGYRDNNANISNTAYIILLRTAKQKFGDNVDVADIIWAQVRNTPYPEPNEFIASGKVIRIE